MDFHLLEKTELLIENIHLSHANLGRVADCVAEVLGLDPRDVAVIDVRPGTVAVDILRSSVTLEQVLGKEKALLSALGAVDGVAVSTETAVRSEGILGLVALGQEHLAELQAKVGEITRQVSDAVRTRAMVFPTGDEVIEGDIEDTNTSFLISILSDLGFKVARGKALADSLDETIGALRNAAEMGYGLVLTTGGVGAEDKDHLVEAISALDPEAATPYIVHYPHAHWRHKKDGVRIAVGSLEMTTFVALPGPHDEVQLAAPVLTQGLVERWDNATLAENLAEALRAKLVAQRESETDSVSETESV